MPEATLNAVADHGDIPDDSIHGTYQQSQAVLDDLAALGIDYGDVVQTLEDQGVDRVRRQLGPPRAAARRRPRHRGKSDAMPASGTFVIVGGGLAGAKAAEALREQGFGGRIVLAAEEEIRPYERPPLSKGYLQGKTSQDAIFVHSPDWYDANRVELLLGTAVTGIDRGHREVTLTGGGRVAYDKLLLATGAVPRRLPLPGADAGGLLYLRRVADSDRIRDTFTTASRVLIVGAGWIGLEVAAAARTPAWTSPSWRRRTCRCCTSSARRLRRCSPTCTGARRRPAARRPGRRDHRQRRQRDRRTARRRHPDRRGRGDRRDRRRPADRAGRGGGLDVRNGVVTDASLRTSDPAIYAAGDVANAFHPLLGTHIRVEHWANALHQPQTAAAAMLGQRRRLRPGAVLLHRPVRPGHGIRRVTPSPAATTR